MDQEKSKARGRPKFYARPPHTVLGNRTSDKDGRANTYDEISSKQDPRLNFTSHDDNQNTPLQRESRGYSAQGKGVPENVTLTSPSSRNERSSTSSSSSSSTKSPSLEQAKGNKAFELGDFQAAIEHYSNAMVLDPQNHILFRSSGFNVLPH